MWSDQPQATHVLRITARARALTSQAKDRWWHKRLDIEWIDMVDLEASSTKAWKHCWEKLSKSDRNPVFFRAGAVSTTTRRDNMQTQQSCRLSGDKVPPIMRHLMAECSHHNAARHAVNNAFGISNSWWQSIPRVSSKSWWITFSADNSLERRGDLQVAICELAKVVMCDPTTTPHLHRSLPRRTSSSSML